MTTPPSDSGSVIEGPCPLVRLGSNSKITNQRYKCTGHGNVNAAIQVVGENVEIQNVQVENGPVFDAASPSAALNIDNLKATEIKSTTETTAAILANCRGAVTLDCDQSQYVIIQPLSGFTIASNSKCVLLNLGTLLGYFGTEYEIDFYTRYKGADGVSGLYNRIIMIEVIIIILGVVVMIIMHQDVKYLRATNAKMKMA